MAWCTECKKRYPDTLEICPECGDLLEKEERETEKPAAEACSSCAGGEGSCSGDCSSCSGDCADCGESCSFHGEEEEENCGDCDPGLWPLDDDGQPVKPALLMTVQGNQLDYQMVLTQLQSFGVPVVGTFTATGTLAKLILGFAGTGMDVLVPENMVELARELLKPVDFWEDDI